MGLAHGVKPTAKGVYFMFAIVLPTFTVCVCVCVREREGETKHLAELNSNLIVTHFSTHTHTRTPTRYTHSLD